MDSFLSATDVVLIVLAIGLMIHVIRWINVGYTQAHLETVRPPKLFGDRKELRDWWHSLLGRHGKYATYAIFLALPSDKEVAKYISKSSQELDLISGDNCLILWISSNQFWAEGEMKLDNRWHDMVGEYLSSSYSVEFAQYFDVGYQELPCLLIFKDIRSKEHVLISLKEMTIEQISSKMRSLFTMIRDANASKADVLQATEGWVRQENLKKTGQAIVSGIRRIGNRTLEVAFTSYFMVNSDP